MDLEGSLGCVMAESLLEILHSHLLDALLLLFLLSDSVLLFLLLSHFSFDLFLLSSVDSLNSIDVLLGLILLLSHVVDLVISKIASVVLVD